MKDAVIWGLSLVATLGVLGCSSDDGSGEPSKTDENTLSYSFESDVAAGQETQRCRYVTIPSDRTEYAVGRMTHDYTAGSHHFLVYRTDLEEIPPGGEEFVECDESNWMSVVRGVVYGAQETDGEFNFPAGVAEKFRPGEVMMVQAHYINTASASVHARMNFHMELVDPATVNDEAGVLFFFNPAIYVPGGSAGSAELSCPLPEQATLGFAASHMHWRGVGYEARSTDAAIDAQLGPLYATTEWSEPVPRTFPLDPPAALPAGSSITYRCDFQNSDPMGVTAGSSAQSDEMCMFVAMYWPRQSQEVEYCSNGLTPSTGTATATETLACFVGCGGQNADCMGPCWQKACPKAPQALFSFLRCAGNACSPSCFLDPTGAACADCANAICPKDYARLISGACD